MAFTPNKGQIADIEGNLRPDILYSGDGAGIQVYLRQTGISYVLSDLGEVSTEVYNQTEEIIKQRGEYTSSDFREINDSLMRLQSIKTQRIDLDLLGCNPVAEIVPEDEVEGYLNFYYAHCPDGITHVKQYNKIIYRNIYPNIDLVYYGNKETGLKYDFIIRPGGNPEQIKLQYQGHSAISIKNKKLEIETNLGNITENIPRVYQNIQGTIVDVDAGYELLAIGDESYELKSQVQFKIGTFNSSYPLVIDPWVTYYGGPAWDGDVHFTVDATGNVFIAGLTQSFTGIASPGAFQTTHGGGFNDAFLAKFDVGGNRIWATYYGGIERDAATTVTTDASGNVYVGGSTASANGIASPGAFQTTFGGVYDAFLAKFDGAGNRIWATYYGGTENEAIANVTIDATGNVYFTGTTESPTAIASGGFQNTLAGTRDGFLVKFDGAGNRIWATYYGGTGDDFGSAVATDAMGNAYLVGSTNSPTAIAFGGFRNTFAGIRDGFLVKFDGAGNRIWATYYGGTGGDFFNTVKIDATGNVYAGGQTTGNNGIASPGAFQTTYRGVLDAFLAKFDAAGNRLWATYLGGTGMDYSRGLAVDLQTNHVYISGDAYSTNFPISPCAYQPNLIGVENAFITRFYPNGTLFYSTFFGGNHEEDVRIALSGCYIYLVGRTIGGLPITPGAYKTTNEGVDVFLTQLYKSNGGLSLPVIALNPSQNNNTSCTSCNGDLSIRINTSCVDSAFYSYKWSTGVQTLNTSDTLNTINGLCAGNYWVEVTSGCNDVDTLFYTITGSTGAAFSQSLTICQGASISVGTSVYGASGVFVDTIIGASVSGCDSIITTTLTVGNPINMSNTQSICQGQSVNIHGLPQSVSGVYSQTFIAVGGCDSISTVTLNVNAISANTITVSACGSYTHNAQVYNASGIYTQTLVNANGCDSLLTLDITINNTINTNSSTAICEGESISIHGAAENTAGVYTQTFVAVGGCDSISEVTLVVNPITSHTITVSACDSYMHNAQVYNASGIYTQTLVNATNCDSILTINLTLTNTIITQQTILICPGDTTLLHGVEEHLSGIYTQTYTSVNGCDSISTIILTYHPQPTAAFQLNPNPGTENTVINFINESVGAISWQWSFGNESNSISTGESPTFIYPETGTYRVMLIVVNEHGCKDTAVKELQVEPDFILYVPNSFTPNDDNHNDEFLPQADGIDSGNYELLIFDRWGNKIFESTNLEIGWDGRANYGKNIAQIDTYVWILLLKDTNGVSHKYTGHVNLLR